jgi:RNA polymerase sigma-70 factor (ECF subfamily)
VTQTSDNALLRRILAGSHEACAEFVREHHAPVYRLLVHLCRDVHLAEDLTQETFLVAWTKIRSFKAASSLNTWLHTIAYRKFIDACRLGERSKTVQTAVDDRRSPEPNPYEAALVNDETRQLYRALDGLPDSDRDILVLHYLQGLSYQQMAVVLEEPSGTVKWRTSAAIEHLRQALTKRSAK